MGNTFCPQHLRIDGTNRMTGSFDMATEVAFADGDTTPDISAGNSFVTANTTAKTITQFDAGTSGQRFKVRIGDQNTTIANGANLVTESGQDELLLNGETLELEMTSSTVARVVSRSSKLHVVYFGGNLGAASLVGYPIVFEVLPAASVADGQVSSRYALQADSVINRITLFLYEFGTDTFDRLRLLDEDVYVFDTGTGLGLTSTAVVNYYPNISIVAGNDLEVEFNKVGTNAAMFCACDVELRTL